MTRSKGRWYVVFERSICCSYSSPTLADHHFFIVDAAGVEWYSLPEASAIAEFIELGHPG